MLSIVIESENILQKAVIGVIECTVLYNEWGNIILSVIHERFPTDAYLLGKQQISSQFYKSFHNSH